MPFDPTVISNPRLARDGDTLAVSWDSSAPAGSWYQVYLDRALAWHGTTTTARLPWPHGQTQFDIGAVLPSEADADFSALLATGYLERAELTWVGGTYLSPSIESFSIYGSAVSGGVVDQSKPIGKVAAYLDGIVTDGWGVGGYNFGGWGRSASTYSWTTPVLKPGTWSFLVFALDAAGNRSAPPSIASVSIVGPPAPPARDPATGSRLRYVFGGHSAMLIWRPSPG